VTTSVAYEHTNSGVAVNDLPDKDVTIFDENNPRSVYTLAPESLKKVMRSSLEKHPEYFNLCEYDLYRKLRRQNKTPTVTDHRIRMRFWDEFDYAVTNGNNTINLVRVTAGVCSRDYLYNGYFKRPEAVAWLMCPPAMYQIKVEEALSFGIDQLRTALEADMFDKKGNINVKLLEAKMKIVAMLDMRVKGSIPTIQKNLNVNVSDKSIQKAMENRSMEEIQRRIDELARKDKKDERTISVEATRVEGSGRETEAPGGTGVDS
jgi:hypothetical protein